VSQSQAGNCIYVELYFCVRWGGYPILRIVMPIYEYISENPEDPDSCCRICSKGFELRRPLDRPPLEVCPLCHHPVKKLISKVNTPVVTKPFSISDAKKAGFTVLEKKEDGAFEKQ